MMKHIKFIVLFVWIIVLLISCKDKKPSIDKKEDLESSKDVTPKDTIYQLTDSQVNSEGVFLFNSSTEILMNWTEWSRGSNQNLLKFAFFDSINQKFTKPITVLPSKGLQMHAESMAKVGITDQGIIYAVFRIKSKSRKSMFGGTIYYTKSSDRGLTWSDKVRLVADKKSDSQSFFDIALLPDGELGITWLDSRMPIHKGRKGKTLYFSKTDGDKSFYKEIPIAGSTCECCRTEIYIDKNKTIHVAYRNIIEKVEDFSNTNFALNDVEIRDMYYVSSQDNGTSFSEPRSLSKDNWHINGCPHTGPTLARNGSELGAIWFSAAANKPGIFFASMNNNQFSKKELLSVEGRHPQMTTHNGKYLVVYEMYYELDDSGYTKIMLEEFVSSLKDKTQTEISNLKTINNHAVISSINNSTILIAWINKNTRNPRLLYKFITK